MDTTRQKSLDKMQWASLLIISTAYLAVGTNIQGFLALFPLVQEEFGVSRAQVGLYSSFYFLSATIIALFTGRIVDHLGAKKGLILGVTAVGVLMIFHSFSPFFGVILAMAFFTGVGFSIITPSVNKGVLELAAARTRAFSMGITHSGGAFGGFVGALFLPLLGSMVGWRNALLFGGLFAVLAGLFISRYYRTSSVPPVAEPKSSDRKEVSGSFKNDLFLLLRNRYILCFCSMGIAFGISISSITNHFTLYLTQDVGYTPALAGLSLGIFQIGGIIGQPGWGWINDNLFRADRRRGLFLLGLLISFFTIFFGFFVSGFSLFWVMTFSFLLGFIAMGMPGLYFTSAGELVSPDHIGVMTGIALVFSRTSMVVAPPLFGLAADLSGSYTYSWIFLGCAVFIISGLFFFLSGILKRTG